MLAGSPWSRMGKGWCSGMNCLVEEVPERREPAARPGNGDAEGPAGAMETTAPGAVRDDVRACPRYALSATGGAPAAAIPQEKAVKTMTADEIEMAHVLIDDHRKWLYPVR